MCMLVELLNKYLSDDDSAVCLKGDSSSVALETLFGILKMDVIPWGGQNVSISLTPRSFFNRSIHFQFPLPS